MKESKNLTGGITLRDVPQDAESILHNTVIVHIELHGITNNLDPIGDHFVLLHTLQI
jgi:hypothetical protein